MRSSIFSGLVWTHKITGQNLTARSTFRTAVFRTISRKCPNHFLARVVEPKRLRSEKILLRRLTVGGKHHRQSARYVLHRASRIHDA